MAEPSLELHGREVRATLVPERGTNGGYSLVIDGTTQSHVNPLDPLDLQLEYVRLAAGIIDGCLDPRRPVRVLHLGGGALTLPRYIGVMRPGSTQHVVELHQDLLDFVLDALPLPDGVELTIEFGDAREAVERAARAGGGYDVAIVDVFSGAVAPRHLSTLEFLEQLDLLLAPDALVIVNTLATRDLVFSREVAATLAEFRPNVIALAFPGVIEGTSLGNVMLAASAASLDGERARAAGDHGPRPIALLEGDALDAFIAGAPVRHDSDPAG
ncbi:spermidine synthase [Agromyces larvae]|uniref:Fused MFS/spermidine synthase n=1 Tax=Agromyces larvae TaxID=2929802 RepID=A0ABY4C9N2_9MICO|nr:fused MFS/spermidine synthase [Agromyces larvae]UOE45385.1 fused MFS/spermidine synthase [Agromyces larvae]